MADRIQIRRGTAAEWALANPILAQGELGLATDTVTLKAGNGVDTWSVLPNIVTGGGGGGVWGDITGVLSDQADLQSELDAKEDIAAKGSAGGYAPLDGSAKVPAANLPSYVDDVLEFADLAGFPGTGEAAKIYVALDTNKTYRWSGSAYIQVGGSSVAASSEIVAGIAELATLAETNGGTDHERIVTPKDLEDSKYLNRDGTKIYAVAAGTNTYTASLTPALTSYVAGQRFDILFTNANSAASTLNIDGLGAKSIYKDGATAAGFGDITANRILSVFYDGTHFQILGAAASGLWQNNGADLWTNTNVGIGTSSPAAALNIVSLLGSTADNAGIILSSGTVATAGAPKSGPGVILRGNAWNTTTGSSQPIDYRIITIAASNSANNTGVFYIQRQLNGGGWTTMLTIEPFNISGNGQNLLGINAITASGGGSFGGALYVNRNTIYGNLEGLTLDGGGTNAVNVSAPSTRVAFISKYWNGGSSTTAPTFFIRSVSQNTTTSQWVLSSSTVNIIQAKNTGEVGIGGAPDPSAKFDVQSIAQGSNPFPRMTASQRTAIASPAIGLHVYQTDGTEGVYVFKSGGWTFAY